MLKARVGRGAGKGRLARTVVGTDLVRGLSAEGHRVFTVDDARELAPSVGLTEGYLRQALHRLAGGGWIVRLRRGLYALSGAVPGTTPVHEFEVAMHLVEPAAISHWSAMSFHGLTEQVPRRVFVLTTARSVPRARGARAQRGDRGFQVGPTAFQFIQVRRERFFGAEDVWVNEARVKITDPERTLLDGLMAPHYCGDFAEVLHAFESRGRSLDVERIVGYALRLDTATAKRAGWILEKQGVARSRLEPLRALPVKGYRVLDPGGPHRGPCDARWRIQVNLPGRVAR